MIPVKKHIQYFQNQTILDRDVTVWARSPSGSLPELLHLKNSYSKKWKIVVDEPVSPCYYIWVRGSGGTADAHGSGPCEVTLLRVQIPSSAWKNRFDGIGSFFILRRKDYADIWWLQIWTMRIPVTDGIVTIMAETRLQNLRAEEDKNQNRTL